MWRDLFKWEKDVRILVFIENVHHMVPSAEDVFHDQIDNQFCGQFLSLTIPIIF